MKERFLTCIICPRGCAIKVLLDEGGAPVGVEGNACPRGEDYAVSECTAPMRTVTTTVRTRGGAVIPVKTDRPIPKGMMLEVMREIAAARAEDGAEIGGVVIASVAGTDANVVVTGKASR